jgi:hypothetical protein
VRGITVSNTRPGKYRRTSSATSADSRVRASYMVSTTPNTSSPGFSIRRISSKVRLNCVSPSSA